MTTAVTTCSTCNKDNTAITDPECGEIVCSNCGAVISEKMEDISKIKGNDNILRPVNVDGASNNTLFVSNLDIPVESCYIYILLGSSHN